MSKNKLWFKRKRYGYGWMPSSIEGWAVIVVSVSIIYALALRLPTITNDVDVIIQFVIPLMLISLFLIYIGYKKGENPRWQWGDKPIKKKK